MTAQQVEKTTVKKIKIEAVQRAKALAVPEFWLTDWLLFVLDKPSLFLITDEEYQLNDSEFEQFNAGVAKMQQGTPLAYLTGYQEFWSLGFKVNEHTLIPRPDTEVLVEQVLHWIQSNTLTADKSPKRLLDLGTGSGCIAISLAHELSRANPQDKWQVVAVDLSEEALKVARHNATANDTTIEFIQSSWYEALATESVSLFEVIVSNPPYIDEADAHLISLQAEPISALSATNQGLADIEHIAQRALNYLHSGGLLAIEHGFNQGTAVRKIFLDNGFESVATVQDYGGNDRVTLGQLS